MAKTDFTPYLENKDLGPIKYNPSESLGTLNIYKLPDLLSAFSENERLLFFSLLLFFFINLLGNFFLMVFYKEFFSTVPFYVIQCQNLYKSIVLYHILFFSESIAKLCPTFFSYFQVIFLLLSIIALVLCFLNISNIRFSLFCMLSSSSFFIAALFMGGVVGKALIFGFYVIFLTFVTQLLGTIVIYYEVCHNSTIVYYSDLFKKMEEGSFRGFSRFMLWLLSMLGFPLFFTFYYKSIAFDTLLKEIDVSFSTSLYIYLIFYTVLQVLFVLRLYHIFQSSVMKKVIFSIFNIIREDDGKIISFSYVEFFMLFLFFFIFYITGFFYMEILAEIPRFGESFSMRRVIDLYPYVEKEYISRKNGSWIYMI